MTIMTNDRETVPNDLIRWKQEIESNCGEATINQSRSSPKISEHFISASWVDRTKETLDQKVRRDEFAKKLRIAKWHVRTRTNSTGFFLYSWREIKHSDREVESFNKKEQNWKNKCMEFLNG